MPHLPTWMAQQVSELAVHAFLELSGADRQEALDVAAAGSGRPIHLLDKDVWLTSLSLDYARMLDDGLLPADTEPFETSLEQCLRRAREVDHLR